MVKNSTTSWSLWERIRYACSWLLEVQTCHHLRLKREMGYFSHCPPSVSTGPMQTLARWHPRTWLMHLIGWGLWDTNTTGKGWPKNCSGNKGPSTDNKWRQSVRHECASLARAVTCVGSWGTPRREANWTAATLLNVGELHKVVEQNKVSKHSRVLFIQNRLINKSQWQRECVVI